MRASSIAAVCSAPLWLVVVLATAIAATEPAGTEPAGADATEPRELTLDDCIELGMQKSFEFLNEEESFILQQLATSLERHGYGRLWTSTVSAQTDSDEVNAESATVEMAKRLLTGGELRLSASSSGAQATGDDDEYGSSVSVSIEQPLLRGAGRLVAREELTQSERNLVYAGRDLILFEQQFLIDIVSQYYRLVQQRLQIANQQEKVDRALDLVRRTVAAWSTGSATPIEKLRATLDLSRARNDLSDAQRRYELQLDSFKLSLALPMEQRVELIVPSRGDLPYEPMLELQLSVPRELELDQELATAKESASPDELVFLEGLRIENDELTQPGRPLSELLDEHATAALANRLDLRTADDEGEDARRALRIARNNLRGDLALAARVGYSTDSATSFDDQELGAPEWSVGLAYEIPLDRVPERTTYRQQLLAYGRSQRRASRVRDLVLLDVRSTVSELHRAEVTVLIQKLNVLTASKRLRRADAEYERGTISNRDVVEAQNELLDAKNAHDRAQIDHIIATLQLRKDAGLLDPDRWREEIR
jgi:outer membrane protein TolC